MLHLKGIGQMLLDCSHIWASWEQLWRFLSLFLFGVSGFLRLCQHGWFLRLPLTSSWFNWSRFLTALLRPHFLPPAAPNLGLHISQPDFTTAAPLGLWPNEHRVKLTQQGDCGCSQWLFDIKTLVKNCGWDASHAFTGQRRVYEALMPWGKLKVYWTTFQLQLKSHMPAINSLRQIKKIPGSVLYSMIQTASPL